MEARKLREMKLLTPADLGHPEPHPEMAKLHEDVVHAALELFPEATVEEMDPGEASYSATTPERQDEVLKTLITGGVPAYPPHRVEDTYRQTEVWSGDEERCVMVSSELAEPYVLYRLGWDGYKDPTWWFGLRMELRGELVLDVCWAVDAKSRIGWYLVESTTAVGVGFVKDASLLTKNQNLLDLAARLERAKFDDEGYVEGDRVLYDS